MFFLFQWNLVCTQRSMSDARPYAVWPDPRSRSRSAVIEIHSRGVDHQSLTGLNFNSTILTLTTGYALQRCCREWCVSHCALIVKLIWLKVRLQPNIGFTFEHAFVVFTCFAESEPIWVKSGALWVHCLGLALTHFGHDPRSMES